MLRHLGGGLTCPRVGKASWVATVTDYGNLTRQRIRFIFSERLTAQRGVVKPVDCGCVCVCVCVCLCAEEGALKQDAQAYKYGCIVCPIQAGSRGYNRH